MNAKNLIAAVAVFAAAGSAFADQTYPFVEHTNIVSTKTRAEVRQELATAHDVAHAPEFVEFTNVASTRTRDEVRKEAIQAAHNTR